MRLKDFEVKAIKNAVYALDKNAKIYLFGSRVDILITDKNINSKSERDKIFLNIIKEQRVQL